MVLTLYLVMRGLLDIPWADIFRLGYTVDRSALLTLYLVMRGLLDILWADIFRLGYTVDRSALLTWTYPGLIYSGWATQ